MYQLVIIDDEEFILEQLVTLFDWPQLGFELVESFSSVQQFLNYNQHHSYDVLLSDIRLGNYSGLELAKTCREENPELEIILISAYSEFDFAKEAIRIKVFEYLLKPITYKAVTDCFLSLKSLLDQKRSEQKDLADNEQKILLLDRRQAVFDFMSGMSDQVEDLTYALQKSGISIIWEHHVFFKVTGVFPTNVASETEQNILTRYGREAFCLALDNLCSVLTGGEDPDPIQLLPSYISNQKMLALLIADSTQCSDADIDLFLHKLTRNLKELLNITVTFSVGKRADTITDSCLRIKNRSIIYGSIPELAHQIMTRLNENNKQSALLLLRWGFEDYSKDLSSARSFSLELASHLTVSQSLEDDRLTAFVTSIQSASTSERIYTCMKEYLANLLLFVQSSESSLYQIEMARQYIDKNYMCDICLDDVANYVSLNPVYFSRFFKKNTGERFTDYLCKIRIEQAINLLKDPQNRAYEICNLVGYQSKKHFYKLFKLYTGYTPIEYRNQFIQPLSHKSQLQEEADPV